jgi:hypothetical protein
MLETPHQYTQRILDFVNGKDPLEAQGETAKTLARLIQPIGSEQLSRRWEPGKWSITEILAHLVDTEIVVSWRMRMVIGQSGVSVQAVDQDVSAQTFDYPRHDTPGFARDLPRAAREQSAHAPGATSASLGNLRYSFGARQGDLGDIVRMYASHDLNHLAQVEKIAQVSGA